MQTAERIETQPATIRADYRKSDSTLRAIEKAKRVPCEVKHLGARLYRVTTPEAHKYVVKFWTNDDGQRVGACNCMAGTQGEVRDNRSGGTVRPVCYHSVWASLADSWLTGYPRCDAELFGRYVMALKGETVWTPEKWDDLRRRMETPNVYWQKVQTTAEAF